MIKPEHDLPVVRRCELLGLSRSTAYYRPEPTSEADLMLMRRIDELHLKWPFLGARRLRDLLNTEGFAVGRKHVGTLMGKMGIAALYRKPRTSTPGSKASHRVYPYGSIAEANRLLSAYFDFYNRIRPHQSLEERTTSDVAYFGAQSMKAAA